MWGVVAAPTVGVGIPVISSSMWVSSILGLWFIYPSIRMAIGELRVECFIRP